MMDSGFQDAKVRKVSVCCVRNLLAVSLLFLFACSRDVRHSTLQDREFTIEINNNATPVKDQGHSQACWLYAMLSMMESEHISIGDSINASVRYILLQNNNDGERGMLPRAIRMLSRFGTLPYDACKDDASHAPKTAHLYGWEYTPKQFAGSICQDGEYVFLTSFCTHPYYEKMVIDVPDNTDRDSFLNLPLDTLMNLMERTIRSGHTFALIRATMTSHQAMA